MTPPTSSSYSIETVSIHPNASADTAVTIQLVRNTEHEYKLNGVESVWGMCWGELRKWIHHPMNHMNLQPDLVELLRRKDVIVSPAPSLLAEIQEFFDYNLDHELNPIHFLKRFPQGTYEYTVISMVCADSLFAQRGASEGSIEHPAPYHESLTFRSDAHPCFVLSFTILDVVLQRWRPSRSIEKKIPIGIVDCMNFVCWGPTPSFYCRPYLGWVPRNVPYAHRLRLKRKRQPRSSVSSSSSGDMGPPRKRYQAASDGPVNAWRYTVVPVDKVVHRVGDRVLEAYRRETARRLVDTVQTDPLYRRTFGTSRALSGRKRNGGNVSWRG